MVYNMYIQYLEQTLTKSRFDHTLRVYETVKRLTDYVEVDVEKVEIAALLHDISKCESDEFLRDKINAYQINDNLLSYNKELWHGPVGAHFIGEKFAITDETIFNCIYYHTTGRAKMTKEELVIFVADYIEPGRHFPGVEEVRQLAKVDLERAAFQALKNTLTFLIGRNVSIHPNTILAYNDLLI